MPSDRKPCHGQFDSLMPCSTLSLRLGCVYKFLWHLKEQGLLKALELALRKVQKIIGGKKRNKPSRLEITEQLAYKEVLNLKQGELVEVKFEQEILATLDHNDQNKGLYWMPTMKKFCGKKFRVYKRMERIMLESTGEVRKIKNTVLLDGVICSGLYGCDRSCFPFWKEAWLNRVPE